MKFNVNYKAYFLSILYDRCDRTKMRNNYSNAYLDSIFRGFISLKYNEYFYKKPLFILLIFALTD